MYIYIYTHTHTYTYIEKFYHVNTGYVLNS